MTEELNQAMLIPKRAFALSMGMPGVIAESFLYQRAAPVPFRYSTYTAPAWLLPLSSSFAPTAMSTLPSPSRSPVAATDEPN